MCGLGVAVGCRMKHAKSRFKGFKVFKGLEGLEGLEGLRAGKRQAWDAHKKPLMCGLGVPVGCRMKHAKGLFKQPIRSH